MSYTIVSNYYLAEMQRFFRGVLYVTGSIVFILLVIISFTIGPLETKPVTELEPYKKMMLSLDTLTIPGKLRNDSIIKTGFSKICLVPPFPVATAGYGNRWGKNYSAIHDSVFVRTIVFKNGKQKVAVVSADLLIIPPLVKELLQKRLPEIGYDINSVFLTATHTHNSIGNWSSGLIEFIYGDYDPKVIEFISSQIITSIKIASDSLVSSEINFRKIDASELVKNRLIDNGKVDPYIRTIEIKRADNKNLLMMSFAAHATCLFSNNLQLSADYPGALINSLEAQKYDFAMFMAGAVASHSCNAPEGGWDCIRWMADKTSALILNDSQTNTKLQASIYMKRVPFYCSEPQVRISGNLIVRPWVFNKILGEFPSDISVLKIGNVVLFGLPCDYSGEFMSGIDSAAANKNLNPVVTGFNGTYMGYITPEKYYSLDNYETRLMNWYPKGTGEYLQDCMKKIIFRIPVKKDSVSFSYKP